MFLCQSYIVAVNVINLVAFKTFIEINQNSSIDFNVNVAVVAHIVCWVNFFELFYLILNKTVRYFIIRSG